MTPKLILAGMGSVLMSCTALPGGSAQGDAIVWVQCISSNESVPADWVDAACQTLVDTLQTRSPQPPVRIAQTWPASTDDAARWLQMDMWEAGKAGGIEGQLSGGQILAGERQTEFQTSILSAQTSDRQTGVPTAEGLARALVQILDR